MPCRRERGPLSCFLRDVRRRTEAPRGAMRAIIAYKAASALLLLVAGLFLLGLIVDREWGDRVRELVMLSGLRADNRFLSDLLIHFGLLSRRSTTALGLVALFYALLETTEVVGLLDRRRWAEYLVFAATVLFLPYEAAELLLRPTAVKVAILLVNIAIAAYLVRAKRLFRDDAAAEGSVAEEAATSLRRAV